MHYVIKRLLERIEIQYMKKDSLKKQHPEARDMRETMNWLLT